VTDKQFPEVHLNATHSMGARREASISFLFSYRRGYGRTIAEV